MIFATVGTQLPFDRLLSGLDAWARRNPQIHVFAQVGASARRFSCIEQVAQLSQADFKRRTMAARLIVSHAGMGTILSAAELSKPIILMPRRAKFNEHRNDHQLDTAAQMKRLSNVTVVEDGEALHHALDLSVARGFEVQGSGTSGGAELGSLISVIRDFVWTGAAEPTVAHLHRREKAA